MPRSAWIERHPVNGSEPTPGGDVIRITRDEANSSHVDDLLLRQKSMQGVTGLVRDRRRTWFYQSWFVLMLAGAVGALCAVGIVEPYFSDMLYYQGPIEQLDASDTGPGRLTAGSRYLDLKLPLQGWIRIKGTQIWLVEGARLRRPDGTSESR